jgi:hypothetical protein
MNYQPGDVVYFIRNQNSPNKIPDTRARVVHSFIGKDDIEHVVVEYDRGKKCKYKLLQWTELFNTRKGMPNWKKASLDEIKSPISFVKAVVSFNADGSQEVTYK